MNRAWMAVLVLIAGSAGSGCCCHNSWFHPFCSGGCSGEAYYGDWWAGAPSCCNQCDNNGRWWGRGSNTPYQNGFAYGNGYGMPSNGMMMQGQNGAMQGGTVQDGTVDENGQVISDEAVSPTPAAKPMPPATQPSSVRPRRTQRTSWTPMRSKTVPVPDDFYP